VITLLQAGGYAIHGKAGPVSFDRGRRCFLAGASLSSITWPRTQALGPGAGSQALRAFSASANDLIRLHLPSQVLKPLAEAEKRPQALDARP
jgi:hypothetical protein